MLFLGLQYTIDKYYKNCTISPITAGQFDSEIDNMQEYLKDKSFVVKMKSPLELFHTDIQTRYVGQVHCVIVYDSKEMYKRQTMIQYSNNFIEVPVPSQESEWSCRCVQGLPASIFLQFLQFSN